MSHKFLKNKYTKWYYSIVNRALYAPALGYTEKHHIIPKSLNGTNNTHNLVRLTAREHFICHLLLTRMTKGLDRSKMCLAVFYLTGRGKSNRNNFIKNSRLYENLKQEVALFVSQQKKGSKQPPRSEIAKERYSASKTGRNNPNFKGFYVTPWGEYESSRLAAKNCPVEITGNFIIGLCLTNNTKPINLLSVCRSKAYLNSNHIGKTPYELGFGFKGVDEQE